MTIEELRRKLALPFNQNPSIEEMRAHGIELPRRHAFPPKAPPLPPISADKSREISERGRKALIDRYSE